MTAMSTSSTRPPRVRRGFLTGLAVVAGAIGLGGVAGGRYLEVAVSRAADALEKGDRVDAARKKRGAVVKAAVEATGIAWPPKEVFLRATKYADNGIDNGVVEVWVGDGSGPLKKAMAHPVCALSGTIGPKHKEGDGQIPEGFYGISALNPRSSYHLSLRVDYPNASDTIRNRRRDPKVRLGGDIMVHGNCVTIGCLPIEDEPIEEVYLVVDAVFGKQRRVPIHIFPRPLHDEGLAALLASQPTADEPTQALWRELHAGWVAFESTKRVPKVDIDDRGAYVVTAR